MAKPGLKKNYLVVKHNSLNEMRTKGMTLQELRLFSIYLSKINPEDLATRRVRFSLSDFRVITDLQDLNVLYFKKVLYNLVRKTVDIPTERGGFSVFNIFRECTVDVDEDGIWYVEIDADDKALPLLFDFQSHFFKYELWNTLRLKGKNQHRMYEVLKQYEKVGYKIISIADLKGMLGIEENEYPQYKIFKRDVLEVCRRAMFQLTDISFDYTPHSKKGRKIHELKFVVTKNKDYIDPLSLSQFIDLNARIALDGDQDDHDNKQLNLDDVDENGIVRATGKSRIYEEQIIFLMTACDNEFTREQIIFLYDSISEVAPQIHSNKMKSHDYLQRKYREMDMRKPTKSRFGYLKALIARGEESQIQTKNAKGEIDR